MQYYQFSYDLLKQASYRQIWCTLITVRYVCLIHCRVCVFDPIPSEDGHETICGQLMEFIHNQQKIEGEQETVFTPITARKGKISL